MKRVLAGTVIGAALVLGLVLWSGMFDLRMPWQIVPDFTEVEVTVALPEEARIVSVEQIALDCRARVHATVPVEGTREHSLFDQVYRTDTVTMEAKGDVDTCVEGTSAQVVHRRDGTTEVIVAGDSIVFVRPRVDAVATASSVEVEKGAVGKLTDVFPWVSDDLGLTPLAYAYAQNVIGGSECMRTAYSVTEDVLVDAYRQQFINQGVDPDRLTVRIEGTPEFSDPPPIVHGDNVTMMVGEGPTECVLADDLAGGASVVQQ